MTDDVDKFWHGWVTSLESLENRLEALKQEIDSHTKPWDIFLDFQNEIKELKTIHLDLTNMS